MSLSQIIVTQLDRLGAVVVKSKNYPESLIGFSKTILALLFDVQWPCGVTFENSPSLDDHYVWMVDFKTQPWDSVDFTEYPCCVNMKFVLIAIADGGNYLIALNLQSLNEDDPDVYIVEHDGFSKQDSLGNPISLGAFLSSLSPESEIRPIQNDDTSQHSR